MTSRAIRATALSLLIAGLAGCGSTTTPAAPSLQPTPSATVISRDAAILARQSYTVDRHFTGHMSDGTVVLVFHSTCTGSADGHCQAIDAFRGSDTRPVWHHEYSAVQSLRLTNNGFRVTSVHYAPGDPLCCPSQPPRTQAYAWNGHTFSPSG